MFEIKASKFIPSHLQRIFHQEWKDVSYLIIKGKLTFSPQNYSCSSDDLLLVIWIWLQCRTHFLLYNLHFITQQYVRDQRMLCVQKLSKNKVPFKESFDVLRKLKWWPILKKVPLKQFQCLCFIYTIKFRFWTYESNLWSEGPKRVVGCTKVPSSEYYYIWHCIQTFLNLITESDIDNKNYLWNT